MIRIGIIGCGRIFPAYAATLRDAFGGVVELAACADIDHAKAESRAAEFGIPRALNVPDLLADPDIRLVANLTIPEAHFDVNKAALEAGKHVYSEKPLALSLADAESLLALATARGLELGVAPDTILGAGLQTCRKLIDDGWIGRPLAAVASFSMGVRAAHYYRPAVGPILDMAPYYVGALIHLLGPVKRLFSATRHPTEPKVLTDLKHPTFGSTFEPEAPSLAAATLEFRDGAVGTFAITTEGTGYSPRIEIIGTEGSLLTNDPNKFSDPIILRDRGTREQQVPLLFHFGEGIKRGVGLVDMARALEFGRAARLTPQLSCHSTEVLLGLLESGRTGTPYECRTTCERPPLLEIGLHRDPFGDAHARR